MITLGIDPGTAICGYGLVETHGSRIKALTYGVIETHPDMSSAMRLKKFIRKLTALLNSLNPMLWALSCCL